MNEDDVDKFIAALIAAGVGCQTVGELDHRLREVNLETGLAAQSEHDDVLLCGVKWIDPLNVACEFEPGRYRKIVECLDTLFILTIYSNASQSLESNAS